MLQNVIQFFHTIGIYDVVLPFLLVFTITFSILERTKVLGTDVVDKVHYPKKSLNSMVSFVVAFLVIASSQLVEAITTISSQMVIVLLLAVFFLLLVGTFYAEEGGKGFKGITGWQQTVFAVIIFLAIVFIFLNALKYEGDSWFNVAYEYMRVNISTPAVGSIILIILIILFVAYITKGPKKEGEEEGKKPS